VERTFTVTHQYLNDPPLTDNRFEIIAYVEDDDGGRSNAVIATLTVNNVDPVLDSLSNTANIPGQVVAPNKTVTLTGAFTDPGILDAHTVTINWGDGTPLETRVLNANIAPDYDLTVDQYNVDRSFAFDHDYETPGVFQINVTLHDDDSTVVSSGTTTAFLSGVSLFDGVLYIIGTPGDDYVKIVESENSFTVQADFPNGFEAGFDSGNPPLVFDADEVVSLYIRMIGEDDNDRVVWVGPESGGNYIVTADALFTDKRVALLFPNELENFEFDGGLGDDQFFVLSTHEHVTMSLFGGGGSDLFQIGGDAPIVIADASLTPASVGPNMLDGLMGVLTVSGGASEHSLADLSSSIDLLQVLNHGASVDQTGTLTATMLDGLGMRAPLTYADFESLEVSLGSGDDTFTIETTLASMNYVIEGGFGDDKFTVGLGDLDALRGSLLIIGGDGTDRIELDDAAAENLKSVDYSLEPSRVDSAARPGAAARMFVGLRFDPSMEEVAVAGTNAANTFHVVPSSFTRFEVDGRLPSSGVVAPRLGDALLIDLTTVAEPLLQMSPQTPGSGVWQFGAGKKSVQFQSIERFNDYLVAAFSDSGIHSTSGVKVFDATSGRMKFEVSADRLYGPASLVGVRAVMGDLTGDGLADLVVGPNAGVVDSVVRIFDGKDGQLVAELRPYADLNFRRIGITVAVGDLDGDGWNDLLVAPASASAAPIRAYSGAPSAFLQKLGKDLLPGNVSFKSGVNLAVADQMVNGPANRGQLFVGTALRGIATVQSFQMDVGGNWEASAGGQFQPFGKTAKLSPRLTTGDVNGDGVQDLIVLRPGDKKGGARVFDGEALGTPLGKEFVTISSKKTANDQFISALDLSGSGQVDVLATFRSDLGRSGSVMRYSTSGDKLGSFTANVSNGPDITGHWLNEKNEALYVEQTGTGLVITDGNGKSLSGSILKTRVTFSGYGSRVSGQTSGDTLVWSNKKVWRKLTLAGVYVTGSGEEIHIQQQGDKLGILSPTGTYRVLTTRQGPSGISLTSDQLAGSFTVEDDEIDAISWSNGNRWRKLRSIDFNPFQYQNFPFDTLG